MGMFIIDTIVNVSKVLLGFKKNLIEEDERTRQKISDYLLGISDCLAAVYQDLVNDKIPYGRCTEMKDYARLLPETLGKAIGNTKAIDLSEMLADAHEVERLAMEFERNPDTKNELIKIDEAAGTLRALAISIKAGLNY